MARLFAFQKRSLFWKRALSVAGYVGRGDYVGHGSPGRGLRVGSGGVNAGTQMISLVIF